MKMIERLLSGEWSVSKFENEYYDFYLEEVPDKALSDEDSQFFSLVQEKLDWTDAAPDPESRSYGCTNHNEFIQLVQQQRDLYWNELRNQQPS